MKTYKRAKPRTKRGGEKELFDDLYPFEDYHQAIEKKSNNTTMRETNGSDPSLADLDRNAQGNETKHDKIASPKDDGFEHSWAKFDSDAQVNETKHDKIASHKDDGFEHTWAKFDSDAQVNETKHDEIASPKDDGFGQSLTGLDWGPQNNEEKPGNIEKGHVVTNESIENQKISKYNMLYIMLFQRGNDNDHIMYILPELLVLFELFGGTLDDVNEFYYKEFLTVKTNTIKKPPLKVTSLKKRNKLDNIRSTRPVGYCSSNKNTIYSCNRMDKLAVLFMHCGNRLNELALWYHGIQLGKKNINRLFENSFSPIDKLIDFFHQSMITVAGKKPNPFILKKFYKLVKYNIKTSLLKMTLYVMIRSVERMIVIERMKYGTMKSDKYVLPYYLQKLQNFRKSIIVRER